MGYQAGAKIDNMASDLNEAMRLRGGPTPEEHFKVSPAVLDCNDKADAVHSPPPGALP